MTITICREYVPLDFDRPPLEAIVWTQTGPPFTPPPHFERHPPEGYTAGLLRAYIDGHGVSFKELCDVLWP